jgi:hypothetical protein
VSHIVSNKWYEGIDGDEGTEAEKLVKAAARLIRAEIREKQYDMESYPPISSAAADKECVPSLLKLFMECIVTDKLKQNAIAQAIVQASRPRSAILPILFGLGVDLDAHGSANLIREVSRLGFCISYDEVVRFKQSATVRNQSPLFAGQEPKPIFVQYAADNVDCNLRTLDGKGTVHALGIISASVFAHGQFSDIADKIPRVATRLTARVVSQSDAVAISPFNKNPGCSLAYFVFQSVHSLHRPITLPSVCNVDLLWNAGFAVREAARPNWSGYMQSTCHGEHPSVSSVRFLPIINLKPTDESCIYTAFLFIQKQAESLQVCTPCVTFDQQLYVKAVDIVIAEKLNVVVKLGGFHTILSFLGSIGFFMRGSGLEEVLGVIYGPNVIEHVLSGKDYQRAIRGHFLVHAALTKLLVDVITNDNPVKTSETVVLQNVENSDSYIMEDDELKSLSDLYTSVFSRKIYFGNKLNNATNNLCEDVLESSCMKVFETKLSSLKQNLSEHCRTSRLWILYMRCVDILKMFLMAERTGNWLLHLDSLYKM